MRTIAIVQSSYIPWKGYFDLINMSDEFVLLDDVQYTRRDWRNRNRIKTANGPLWLTIPVRVRGRYAQRIDETEVADPRWAEKHWRSLERWYRRSPAFSTHASGIEALYRRPQDGLLSRINEQFIRTICALLGITTPITRSEDYEVSGESTERLLAICRRARASRYLSGPRARAYLDVERFESEGISVSWMDYSGYPEYEQAYPPFDHHVSILDLLFNTGADAPRYLKSTRP